MNGISCKQFDPYRGWKFCVYLCRRFSPTVIEIYPLRGLIDHIAQYHFNYTIG